MQFKGILFDLDGTIIESITATERAWCKWGLRNQIDLDELFANLHGRPAEQTIRRFLPDASEEQIAIECQWQEDLESTDTEGVYPLPGAIEFLQQLNQLHVPWAIVTSGTIRVATARMHKTGVPTPPILITPECVTHGKPHPEPYQLGAKKLGLNVGECLVFEDAVSGVEAGKAAGCRTIGILTHLSADDLAHADECVNGLSEITVEVADATTHTFNLIKK